MPLTMSVLAGGVHRPGLPVGSISGAIFNFALLSLHRASPRRSRQSTRVRALSPDFLDRGSGPAMTIELRRDRAILGPHRNRTAVVHALVTSAAGGSRV